MVGNQINRSDSLGFHIFHNHIEQMPCDTFAAVVFLCIDRSEIYFDEKGPTIFIRTHNTDLKNRLTAPYGEERRRAASEAAKNE